MNDSSTQKQLDWTKMSPPQIEDYQLQERKAKQQKANQERKSLLKLEQIVLQSISALSDAESDLKSGNDKCGKPFINSMNYYLSSLANMGEMGAELDDFHFGIGVCEYIDEGRNPTERMKNHFHFTQKRNMHTKARVLAANHLQQYLMQGGKHFNHWTTNFKLSNSANIDL